MRPVSRVTERSSRSHLCRVSGNRFPRCLRDEECLIPEEGDVNTVVSASGAAPAVDARDGRYTCPDAQHKLDAGGRWKHARRLAFTTGVRTIPAWIDREAIDEGLGAHVDGAARVAATDGGADVIDAGDDGEVLDEAPDAQSDDDRPDDCSCAAFHTDDDRPCWPCYRVGFDTTPRPDE